MAIRDIIFKLRTQGAEKVKDEFEDIDDSVDSTESGLAGMGVAMAKVVAGAIALKKAFDFGREGAEFRQLSESFEFMAENILNNSEMLNELRRASKGTISDFKLMSGVLTLTAGMSREMAQEFGNAIPKLLEIAKASAKLNPALGDTAFLYESIAMGIKRGSPMILDNLGIVVKLGEANEQYAEALGKTVDELSSADRQQALLNATIKAGDTIIEQAGGSVEAYTDAYDQLATKLDNAWRKGLTLLDEFVRPMVEILNVALESGGSISEFGARLGAFYAMRDIQELPEVPQMLSPRDFPVIPEEPDQLTEEEKEAIRKKEEERQKLILEERIKLFRLIREMETREAYYPEIESIEQRRERLFGELEDVEGAIEKPEIVVEDWEKLALEFTKNFEVGFKRVINNIGDSFVAMFSEVFDFGDDLIGRLASGFLSQLAGGLLGGASNFILSELGILKSAGGSLQRTLIVNIDGQDMRAYLSTTNQQIAVQTRRSEQPELNI